MLLTLPEFSGGKFNKIMASSRLNGRVGWRECLHKYSSPFFPAACSACNLCNELERTFSRPKVRQMQRGICGHNSYQRHAREIETLGNHLGSEQNPQLAAPERCQYSFMTAAATHRIGIHALAWKARESVPHLLLEPLGAQSAKIESRTRALRTLLRWGQFEIAKMADRGRTIAVVHQRNITALALLDMAALQARNVRGKATTV
jgi:hypothetical protein